MSPYEYVVASYQRGVEGAVLYAFRDGGPVPYGLWGGTSTLSYISYPVSYIFLNYPLGKSGGLPHHLSALVRNDISILSSPERNGNIHTLSIGKRGEFCYNGGKMCKDVMI